MATAYSLLALRQALAEEAFAGQFPIRILTTAAGSVTALVIGDLAFGVSGGSVNQYHGCWLYNANASPTAPFSSRVLEQAGLTLASGTLTVAPPFGSAPGNGAEIIFCYDLHPDELHRAINRILRNLTRETIIPVTLLTNGDFEVDAANWTPTNATLTRVTTPISYVRHGEAAGRILSSGGASSIRSDSVRTTPGEQLIVSLYGRCVVGTMTLELWDPNLVLIPNATATSNLFGYQELVAGGGYVTVATEWVYVAVKGLGVETDDLVIDDAVIWPVERKWFDLPSYVSDPGDIVDVGYFRRGRALTGTNAFQADEQEWVSWPFDVYVDTGGVHPLQLQLKTPVTQPLFARVRRRFAELTTTAATINATTNTTQADRDTVVQGAMHYIERARYARIAASNPQLAALHLGRSREYARKFAMMRQAQGYGIQARENTQARTTVAMT